MFRLVIAIVINPRMKRVTMHAWTLHAIVWAGLSTELVVDGVWISVSPPQATPVVEPTDAAITQLVCTYPNQVRASRVTSGVQPSAR